MNVQEVFLSHSAANHVAALSLAKTLQAHGVPVWMAPLNLRGGQQWHDEIGLALDRCDWFAVLISPSAIESMWVKRELTYALNQRRLHGKILPLLWEKCDHRQLSWTISISEIVDLSENIESGLRMLMRVWGTGYAPKLSAF